MSRYVTVRTCISSQLTIPDYGHSKLCAKEGKLWTLAEQAM